MFALKSVLIIAKITDNNKVNAICPVFSAIKAKVVRNQNRFQTQNLKKS
jgi:hypothetical protein